MFYKKPNSNNNFFLKETEYLDFGVLHRDINIDQTYSLVASVWTRFSN